MGCCQCLFGPFACFSKHKLQFSILRFSEKENEFEFYFGSFSVHSLGFPGGSDGTCLQCRRCWFESWVGKILWRRERLLTPVFLDFPCGSAGKKSDGSVGDLSSIPGLGRYPGEGKGYPLQYSGLENSMDCIVHAVTKSRRWLSNFHFSLQVIFSRVQGSQGHFGYDAARKKRIILC